MEALGDTAGGKGFGELGSEIYKKQKVPLPLAYPLLLSVDSFLVSQFQLQHCLKRFIYVGH